MREYKSFMAEKLKGGKHTMKEAAKLWKEYKKKHGGMSAGVKKRKSKKSGKRKVKRRSLKKRKVGGKKRKSVKRRKRRVSRK